MEDLKESSNQECLTAKLTANNLPGLPHICQMLTDIYNVEPVAFEVLRDIIKHIHGTYGDKYESDASKVVNCKHLLTKTEQGKWSNAHAVLKYFQRYISDGYPKSDNPYDLIKAVHFIVFELTRRRNLEAAPSHKDIMEK